MMGEDEEESPSNKEELMFEPAAEMDMGKLPKGASMPVTDLYRRKHKTDSKSKALTYLLLFLLQWLCLSLAFSPDMRILILSEKTTFSCPIEFFLKS